MLILPGDGYPCAGHALTGRFPVSLTVADREIKGEYLMKKLIKYLKETRLELKKVVWPNRETVISSTKVVIVSTLIFAVVLGLIDYLLLEGLYLVY